MRGIKNTIILGAFALLISGCGNSNSSDDSEKNGSAGKPIEVSNESEETTNDVGKDNKNQKPDAENDDAYVTTSTDGFLFKSNGDGTCVITGIENDEIKDLVIPQTSPNGENVVEIEDEAFRRVKAENLVMNNLTMTIGKSAFGSSEIKNISINNCKLTIDENAFAYSDDIESFSIEGGELIIDEYALYNSGDHLSINI